MPHFYLPHLPPIHKRDEPELPQWGKITISIGCLLFLLGLICFCIYSGPKAEDFAWVNGEFVPIPQPLEFPGPRNFNDFVSKSRTRRRHGAGSQYKVPPALLRNGWYRGDISPVRDVDETEPLSCWQSVVTLLGLPHLLFDPKRLIMRLRRHRAGRGRKLGSIPVFTTGMEERQGNEALEVKK